MIYIKEKNDFKKTTTNFKLVEGAVRVNVGATPKKWKYITSEYGTLLKMPYSDYVTNNKDWESLALMQREIFDGFIFVFPESTTSGYRPIDVRYHFDIVEYINEKNL